MIASEPGGFTIESEVFTGPAGEMRYRIALTNYTEPPVADFRLAVTGPGRIHPATAVDNGTLVRHISSYAEFAPPSGFVLAIGAHWTFELDRLDSPVQHWTDGITAGFLILTDGSVVPATTHPARREGSGSPRIGTKRLKGTADVPISATPWPNRVAVEGRRTAPRGLSIAAAASPAALAARDAFAEICGLLFPTEGLVCEASETAFSVTLHEDASLALEAYRIEFLEQGIRIEAADASGYFYGLITLGQLLRGALQQGDRFGFPASGIIEDAPAMRFRGCHLDVARRFYDVATIRRFLAILAWNKLNVFHWHLSDDEGWRVEIETFPRLAEIGAWRGHGLPLPPLLGSGPEKSGGYYSKSEITGLVALAGRLGIEVIPEIDVPGHCHALLKALPELRDPDDAGTCQSAQLFPNNCLNPAVEAVYRALDGIFGEMLELFPGRYFHVGADEVPAAAWQGSPAATALRQRLGADAGSAALQAHFLRRVQAFLTGKGKVTGAWQEAARGGGIDQAKSYLVGWRDSESSRRLAAAGYAVVAAPQQAYYLDMAQGPEWEEPGASWAQWSSPQATYDFDPAAGWADAEKANLLGHQACIWSETMIEPAIFDRLVFPRLSAVAETAWTNPESKSFPRFAALSGLMPNLYGCYEGSENVRPADPSL